MWRLARDLVVVEAPVSFLLQHKGLLALLSEALPDHPNVLRCSMASPTDITTAATSGFVHKPFHGVEGNSVRIFHPDGRIVQNARTMPIPEAGEGVEGVYD